MPGNGPGPVSGRRFALALALVTLLGLALRSLALPGQPPLGDDLGSGISTVNYVERGQIGPTMWHHPRLRDLAVYPSLAWLGPSKLGLVLPSLLLGTLAVAVVGLLARRLAGERAGLLAAFLLAIDSLAVGYSRQAIQEIYPLAFGAAGVLMALEYDARRRPGWLAAAGVAFGLGIASKWSGLFPLAVMLAWTATRAARGPRGGRAAGVALALAALGAMPLAIYALTWAPWLARGRDLLDLLALHRAMAAEAATHGGFNPTTVELPHRAATWFLWPSAYADSAVGPGGPVRYVAITNPVVWLLVLPGCALALRRAWRGEGGRDGLMAALVLATWLPFAATSRPIWVHSALAVLPFALVAVASLVVRFAGAAGPRARAAVVAYAALAALAAAPLYLLAAGFGEGVGPLRPLVERFRPTTTLDAPPPR